MGKFDDVETVVYLLKRIDEEDYLISIGEGQGYQYYEAVIEDYKRKLCNYTPQANDEGRRLFEQWKKDSYKKFEDEYAKIDNLCKYRKSLGNEIDIIRHSSNLKWFFCSKDKAIDQLRKDQQRVKEEIYRAVIRIYD